MKRYTLAALLLITSEAATKNVNRRQVKPTEPTNASGDKTATKQEQSFRKKARKNLSAEVASIATVEGTKAHITAQEDAQRTRDQQKGLSALSEVFEKGNAADLAGNLDKIHSNEASEEHANYSLSDSGAHSN